MTRQLAVDAGPLDDGYILGLRESFATATHQEVKLDWCHTFGYGGTQLSLEATFPDGTTVTETMKLMPLLQAWALQLINEQKEKSNEGRD
jgi:hypothetical protein